MSKFVNVRFTERECNSNKEYTYRTDIELAIDDKVVVCVNGSYKVVTVTRVDVVPRINANEHIVCRVDVAAYVERKAKRQRMETLKTQMRTLKTEMDDELMYRMFMKKLLNEYEA